MKIIILEHPRIPSKKRFNDIANTPLWSCLMGGYAAASLEQAGFNTIFMDHADSKITFKLTLKKILAIAPDLLCVNAVYFWEHTPELFDFFENLRHNNFSGHINLFGFFPSLACRQIFIHCNTIDSIAVGEFEYTLVELAKKIKDIIDLESNRTEPFNTEANNLDSIQGLALASSLSDNQTKSRLPQKNLDAFTFPKRSSLKGTVTILGSRGCYNHCSFCPVPSFYNQKNLWRGRSPENIAKEMLKLKDQGVTRFYFADPNFIGPGKQGIKRCMDLMTLIKPMDITFGMETRPQDLTDELLEKLTRAGMTTLLMGIESGSKSILECLNKSSAANVGTKAILLCRKHGIEPEIGFLMFVPDAGLDDLTHNINFLMENNLLDYLARTANLLCHSQIVLAGTTDYTWFEKQNRLTDKGIFGFEANVSFLNPDAEWMSKLIIFACHTVLRSMSDKNSPIFWKNEDTKISRELNNFLIQLFYKFLNQAKTRQITKDILKIQISIQKDINNIIYPDNTVN